LRFGNYPISKRNEKQTERATAETIQKDMAKIITETGNKFKGRSVLITGGAGFLGSWLCEAVVRSGASATCIDDLSTGRKENINHLVSKGNSPFKFLKASVEDVKLKEEYDFILHFASRASPEEYQQHPIETLKANSLGTLNLLNHALRDDATFLYASTSEVYGDTQIIPTPETYWGNVNPIGVRSCYDEGKRFGEALCVAYSKENGLDVRLARLFNTYGPKIRADGAYARALPRFITQALRNEPITIYGDGNQTRSFCYVSDTITGILELASAENLKGEVVNIGNPHEITINQLAETIIRLTNTKSKIMHLPRQPDDPQKRKPDISKATKLLKWQPKVDLEEGLKKTIEWFSHHSPKTY
jgi:UDP-glucuronate decarboxylase